MKNYTITVNGNVYDVTVEENAGGAVTPTVATPKVAAPAVAKKVAPVEQKVAGAVEVTAGASGKVFKVEAPVGTSVKRGDAVVIIEAMKMEIPCVAPADGVVASIELNVGDACEAGTVLATLN
jgi:biotin carboxyl carrier protein